jgi:glycerol-3-phosphate O-acyltransferase
MKRADAERARVEVACRVLGEKLAEAASGAGPAVEELLHQTIYLERQRLDREPRATPRRDADRTFIEALRLRALATGPEGQKALLRELIEQFTNEIVGNFDPRVYKLATTAVPGGLALLLNALSPSRLIRRFPALPHLSTNVTIRGEVETLKRLDELGTIILCPTHLSNLDSPVVGWALSHLGLPPYVYGAGINLFQNPLLSFFMQNLGAYRVDRKKVSRLYKNVLKTYCTMTLELGYDNLFFPGGTRSRSGAVEPKLKLGLLGCGVQAYVHNLIHQKQKPNIYVVPCTMSYGLVLEAETLIADYLKEVGKARYVIEDDESSRLTAWLRFLSGIATMDSRIYLTISEPLDLFGNRVEADGLSYDRRGRPIDTTRYVLSDGAPVHDPTRDQEYTAELGEAILRAFRRDNTLQSTHLAAFTVFELLRRRWPDLGLYRLLRTAPADATFPWTDACAALERVLAQTRALSDDCRVRLDPRLRTLDAAAVLKEAIQRFRSYHTRPALTRHGDRVFADCMNTLFYYHNRATGYGLEVVVQEGPPPPPIDLARRPSGEPLLPPSRLAALAVQRVPPPEQALPATPQTTPQAATAEPRS